VACLCHTPFCELSPNLHYLHLINYLVKICNTFCLFIQLEGFGQGLVGISKYNNISNFLTFLPQYSIRVLLKYLKKGKTSKLNRIKEVNTLLQLPVFPARGTITPRILRSYVFSLSPEFLTRGHLLICMARSSYFYDYF